MANEKETKVMDVKDVLKALDKANEAFAFSVWIPSLGKDVMFREIKTSQQKNLVKSIIDSPIYNTQFIFALKGIIDSNCVDDIDTNRLTILDKLAIALALRSKSVGDVFEVELNCDNNSKDKDGKVSLCNHKVGLVVNVHELIDKIKSDIDLTKLEDLVIKDDVYTITCKIPNIDTEYRLEKELREHSDVDIQTPDKLREIIGDAFIGEVTKFISTMVIQAGDEQMEIDFGPMAFKDRLQVAGHIPGHLLNDIVNYAGSVKAEIERVVIKKIKCGKCKQDIDWRLSIDGNFFISS